MVKKILKLSASWCMPCHVYARTFNAVKEDKKYKDIVFEEVDVDEHEDLAIKYSIRGVPTTVILGEEDKVLSKFSGNVPRAMLEKEIDKANGQIS